MKKVLVIGGGGREHANVYALSRSPQVEKIYCAPGNAGIAQLAECVAIKDTDVEGLLLFAKETEVDLTVVGPEAALAAGVTEGLILASDGFLPFDDTVALAAQYGVTAIVQPGGSIRDNDCVVKADELGICMLMTGTRHFKH